MGTVHVVHCIDTEGPIHEPLMATFERIDEIFGIQIEPSIEALRAIQRGELDLGGHETEAAAIFSVERMAYNDTWDKIDAMLAEMMSPAFRNAVPDSFGGGWIYNWHCVDHVGFTDNPRRRDIGFHGIFDHYKLRCQASGSESDGIHFHHHPIPFSRSAHHPATHFFNHCPQIFEILARRIIDRKWFPSVNRPGFHATRPDSHWFLEQFIPFDVANQSTTTDEPEHKDVGGGRFGDWRRAPTAWAPYHPAHDDYQTPGDCRRWIARCLNVGGRVRALTDEDVDQAFAEAAQGQPVVLAFANHDYRDMRPDVLQVQAMLQRAAAAHPDVKFRYAEVRDALRQSLRLDGGSHPEFTLNWAGETLDIRSSRDIFGPQPFLALRTRDGRYLHDNLDIHQPYRHWSYTLDQFTRPADAVSALGVAANDDTGNTTISVVDMTTGEIEHTYI